MSVKRLPTGGYQARYRDAAGREHARNFPVGRKRQADDWERAQREAVRRGDWVDPAAGKVTFGDYAEGWLKAHPVRQSTRDRYRRTLDLHIFPTFKDRRIASIRPSEVRAWHAGLSGADSTRSVIYVVLSAIFKAAVEDEVVTKSPCLLKVRPRAKDEAPIVPLDVDQVDKLIDAMPTRYANLSRFTSQTGLRVSEATGLTVDRIDFLRREAKVDRQLVGVDRATGHPLFGPPKSAAGFRTVPLSDEALDSASAQLAEFGQGFGGLVFAAPSGKPLTRGMVSTAIIKARRAAELPDDIVFHDLRHFFASLLIRYGCSVKTVQVVLGHESAAMTLDVYGHLWPDSDDAVRGAIKKALASREANGQGADGASEASAVAPHPRDLAAGLPPTGLVASVPG